MARKTKQKDHPVVAIVPKEEIAVRVKKIVVAKHTFTPVILPDSGTRHLVKMSQREAKFLDKLTDTGSLAIACQEIGIDRSLGERYMKRKSIKAILSDRLRQLALSKGLTVDKMMAVLHEGMDGAIDLSATQLECLKITARVLKPAGTQVSVTLNQQNNNNFNGPSPYEGMGLKEIGEALKRSSEDFNALNG